MANYKVTVDGVKKDEDGGHGVVGWVTVQAATEKDARRLALATKPGLVTWETEGDDEDPEKVVGISDVEVES